MNYGISGYPQKVKILSYNNEETLVWVVDNVTGHTFKVEFSKLF